MRQRAPIALLGIAVAASGTLLFSLTANLIFVGDGWELLAGRPDWSIGTFVDPWNEHLIVLPAVVYKLLLSTFGMDSAFPYYAVSISLFLLSAVLLFTFLRRRVGDWVALFGSVLVLFLGAAYEDLLWEFQMAFFGSMAAGLGALLALDRKDRAGDRTASVMLLIAIAWSTLGVPFVAAAIANVALGPRPRLRRAYVPLLPLLGYATWWLAASRPAGIRIGLADVPDLPRYVFDAASAGLASLLGQQPVGGDGSPPMLAQLLAILLAVVLVWWVRRQGRISSELIAGLVLLFSFWALLAVDRGPMRFSSRFQYPSAVFLLIVTAEALRGQRFPRAAGLAAAVIAAAAVVGGVSLLDQGYSQRWKPTSDGIRATLAAIDIAGSGAQSDFAITLPPSVKLQVAEYREARSEHGTPAFSEGQLLAAGEGVRQVADRTLTRALAIKLLPPVSPARIDRCRRLPLARRVNVAKVEPGDALQIENRGGGDAVLQFGRFARLPPAHLGRLHAGQKLSLRIPLDNSPRAWRLGVYGGPVELCSIR